jgi:hypothetical protein
MIPHFSNDELGKKFRSYILVNTLRGCDLVFPMTGFVWLVSVWQILMQQESNYWIMQTLFIVRILLSG